MNEETITLPKGTIIKVRGFPAELTADAVVISRTRLDDPESEKEKSETVSSPALV